MTESIIVVLDKSFIASPNIRDLLKVNSEQISKADRDGEVTVVVTAVDVTSAGALGFELANMFISVPWSVVRSVVRIKTPRTRQQPQREIVPPQTEGGWMA